MSSIWTPGGERPVARGDGDGDEGAEPGPAAARRRPDGPGGAEVDEELAEVQRQLAETPAAVVVANHALGLFHLAALHLAQQPPNLADAQLAIDGMATLVEGLRGRLGEDEAPLTEALSQLRLAYVQITSAPPAPHPPPPRSGGG